MLKVRAIWNKNLLQNMLPRWHLVAEEIQATYCVFPVCNTHLSFKYPRRCSEAKRYAGRVYGGHRDVERDLLDACPILPNLTVFSDAWVLAGYRQQDVLSFSTRCA